MACTWGRLWRLSAAMRGREAWYAESLRSLTVALFGQIETSAPALALGIVPTVIITELDPVHPFASTADTVYVVVAVGLAVGFVYGVNAFKQRVGWQPAFTRTHFLTWWGWDEIPRTYAEMGIRMDLSITGMNPFRQFQLPSMPGLRSPTGYGYINGSGLPMRYTTLEGKLLGVYSQLTQVEDDVISAGYIQIPGNDSLTTAMLKEANRQLIDESVDRFHTALVWNCHPQHSMTRFPKESPLTWGWLTATVDHLVKRGVPMLSVDEWLQFTETRFAVEIHMLPHDPSSRTTEWTVVSPSDVHGLTLALPVEGGDDESLTIVATTADSMRMDVPLRISVVSCEGRRVALISGDFHKNSTIHFRCTQE